MPTLATPIVLAVPLNDRRVHDGAVCFRKIVAETLLRQKKKVRVVLHDDVHAKAWGEAGADVAIACFGRAKGEFVGPRSELTRAIYGRSSEGSPWGTAPS